MNLFTFYFVTATLQKRKRRILSRVLNAQMGYECVCSSSGPLTCILLLTITRSRTQVGNSWSTTQNWSWRTMVRLRARGHALRWRQSKRAAMVGGLRGDWGNVGIRSLFRVTVRIKTWRGKLHGVEISSSSNVIELIQLFKVLLKNSEMLSLELLLRSFALSNLIPPNLRHRFELNVF